MFCIHFDPPPKKKQKGTHILQILDAFSFRDPGSLKGLPSDPNVQNSPYSLKFIHSTLHGRMPHGHVNEYTSGICDLKQAITGIQI